METVDFKIGDLLSDNYYIFKITSDKIHNEGTWYSCAVFFADSNSRLLGNTIEHENTLKSMRMLTSLERELF